MDSLARPNQDLVRALQLLLPIFKDLRRTIILSHADYPLCLQVDSRRDEDRALATITDAEALKELRELEIGTSGSASTKVSFAK